MAEFPSMAVYQLIKPITESVGIQHVTRFTTEGATGLRVGPYKKTWQRKRTSAALVRVQYWKDGVVLLNHVEPWPSFPSDLLISKLMLLPPEVTKEKK